MGEAWVITSGKGGVGKSTLTANLGVALARLEKRVLLIDGDTGLRNLDVLLGLENNVVYDLNDAAEGVCRLAQALVRDRRHEGLCMMAASQQRESGSVSAGRMDDLVSRLRDQFDYILIDSPAGVGRGFRAAVAAADRAILVVIPDVVCIRDAERVLGLMERYDLKGPKLIVNRVRREHWKRNASLGVAAIEARLQLPVFGTVPEDRRVDLAAQAGVPVADGRSKAALAYASLARALDANRTRAWEARRGFWGLRARRGAMIENR